MWLVRCASLFGSSGGGLPQLEAAGAALLLQRLQRLQSSLECSPSTSGVFFGGFDAAPFSRFYCSRRDTAATTTDNCQDGSCRLGRHPWRLRPSQQQQQQQHALAAWPAQARLCNQQLHSFGGFGARHYARARGGRPPYSGGGASSGTGRGPRGGPSGGPSSFSRKRPQPLGRLRANCPPLAALPAAQAQAALLAYDPWESHHPLNNPEPSNGPGLPRPGPLPRAIDGAPEEDALQYSLVSRELIEKSTLPSELKHLTFDAPWEELLLDARRTVKVTSKGRLETMHVTSAVGNMRGLIGVGMSAGSDLQQVMLNSLLAAYKAVVPVPLYRAHTVYHPIDHQFRTLRIRMWPRPQGFGVTASPLVQSLCSLVGIQNVTVKLNGRRRNVDNVVKAWLHAVTNQSLPHDGVEGSGVYVREVYHRAKLPLGLKRGLDV